MTAQPHERPEFRNAVTYTVSVTYTVEGGARQGTADRRARRVAERLANAASRMGDVVEVSAVAGFSQDNKIVIPYGVRFSAANTGHGTVDQPDKLDRYLDPEFERALRSLEAANAAFRARQEADRQRRREVGCANPYDNGVGERRYCACVYCRPGLHAAALDDADRLRAEDISPSPIGEWACVCGQHVPFPADRCLRHRDTRVVLLDGDTPDLARVAEADQGRDHGLER